jgi:DNA-binding transcriptional LysR family regulator
MQAITKNTFQSCVFCTNRRFNSNIQRHLMNLDQLQTFIHVARTGSFAAAARSEAVDPSLISRAVANLEDSLGFRLFQRTTRALSLTEAGAAYLARIAPLAEEMQLAREQALQLTQEPQGQLRVTSSVSFGQMCIVPHLAAFRAAYPKLALELILTDSVVDLVAERIDVAIRLSARVDSGYIGQELLRTRYRVVASPGYVARHGKLAHPRDLTGRDCASFPIAAFRHKWRFRAAEAAADDVFEVPINSSITISSGLALRQAAIDGLAPSLLAQWLVDDALLDGRLVDLFPGFEATATDFQTAAWILYPSREYLPLKVRAFTEHLKACLMRV